MIGSIGQDSAGIAYMTAMMATLFVLVLLHEFGHCLACRLVGGQADDVLMWPLGGLAMCAPPRRWKAALITTLAGPGVNAVLLPVFGGVLLLCGASWEHLIFNPFRPNVFAPDLVRAWLWSAYYTNLMLLAFNMLVPMFPMDCGRVVQELLWWRLGYKRSMVIAVNLGLVVAVGLVVFGLSSGQSRLVTVGVFGGFVCFGERRRLQLMAEEPAWAFDTDKGYGGFEGSESASETAAERRALKATKKRAADQREARANVDRILDKIAAHGLQSLTQREKDTLNEATDRERKRKN